MNVTTFKYIITWHFGLDKWVIPVNKPLNTIVHSNHPIIEFRFHVCEMEEKRKKYLKHRITMYGIIIPIREH